MNCSGPAHLLLRGFVRSIYLVHAVSDAVTSAVIDAVVDAWLIIDAVIDAVFNAHCILLYLMR